MKRYRIHREQGYNGCFPITIYWVQVKKEGFFSDSWENIKGFEDCNKAEQLLELLEGGL